MRSRPLEIAILIVSYNGRDDLADCLDSIFASAEGEIIQHIVVVDNGSTDATVDLVRTQFPEVHVISLQENLGFAGGNNFGWKHIQENYPDTKYVCLLNQDTLVEAGWLRPLVEYLESHPQTACVQPKIKLFPRKEIFNTVGNRSHFLGFGFTTGYGEVDRGQYEQPASIDYASGAALLVRSDSLRRAGLFDSILFMYLEDAELGWKLRQLNQQIVYIPQSCVYHKYAFKGDYRFYFYLERNRWWLLLTYYKALTLLLLAPALVIMEGGQLWFASQQGRLADKLRTYRFFLARENRRRLWESRRAAQARRTVGDRYFLRNFTGSIQTPELNSPLVRWVANPVLAFYWSVAKRLITW